jgi:hypothetical protein
MKNNLSAKLRRFLQQLIKPVLSDYECLVSDFPGTGQKLKKLATKAPIHQENTFAVNSGSRLLCLFVNA